MLLPSMTYKEMYDHLAADFEKVKIKKEYLLSKAVREFKKERRFPVWKCYEYTIPSTNNKYIIFFYAENRYCIEKPKVDYFCVAYDNCNRYVIKVGCRLFIPDGGELMPLREIQVYTGHFFERYKERWLNKEPRYKDILLNANDISCIYLSRNKDNAMPIEMNDEINKRIDKYGEGAKYGYRVRDGFCFTLTDGQQVKGEDSKERPIARYVVYKTFMNESDMANTQLSAIDKEYYQSWLQYQRTMQEKLQSGNTTLILEK